MSSTAAADGRDRDAEMLIELLRPARSAEIRACRRSRRQGRAISASRTRRRPRRRRGARAQHRVAVGPSAGPRTAPNRASTRPRLRYPPWPSASAASTASRPRSRWRSASRRACPSARAARRRPWRTGSRRCARVRSSRQPPAASAPGSTASPRCEARSPSTRRVSTASAGRNTLRFGMARSAARCSTG